jgi:transcription antitermination factor NusG
MPWTVAFTKPNLERCAARHLGRMGMVSYLPCYRNEYRHKQLLLPRYIFILIMPEWELAWRARGVVKVFMRDAKVPFNHEKIDGWLDDLRARECNGVIDMKDDSCRFRPGQRLRVIRGQFARMMVTYDRRNSRGKDEGFVDIMGRKARVEFQPDQLSAELT